MNYSLFCRKFTFFSLVSRFVFLLLILLFLLTGSYSQPANDNICSAASLTVDATNCSSGTNASATIAGADPVGGCWVGGTKSHNVWYSFVAPASGNLSITTDHYNGGNLGDPQMCVYSSSNGTCTGTLTELGCNDDVNYPANTQSTVTLPGLTPGTTYFVQIDGYSTQTGTFCVDVHDGGSLLTNDNCSNAMNLWVGAACNFQNECSFTNYPTPITTTATSEAWETAPACWTQGTALNTVWFKFTAVSSSTRLQVEHVIGGVDPHAAVYSGTCGSLSLVSCQEDVGGSNKGVDLTFATTAGQTYYIQYDHSQVQGCNNICLSSTGGLTTPSNNNCSAAQSISSGSPVTGNTWLGTADGSFNCGTTENSVWYKFTPTISGTYEFELSDQTGCTSLNNSSSIHTNYYSANVQMSVYNTGTCTPTTANEMGCTSNHTLQDISMNLNVTAGNTYLILIDGLGNAGCQFTFSVDPVSLLAVDLASFEGKNDGEVNVLRWITQSEQDNSYFTLEKSADRINFTELWTVTGSGTSSGMHTYMYADRFPYPGVSYYRLKQTDYKGNTSSVGDIVEVFYKPAQEQFMLTLYPNPNKGNYLYLSTNGIDEETLKVSIKDVVGRECLNTSLAVPEDGSAALLNLEQKLMGGVYVVVAEGQKIYSQRLVVK